MNATFGSNNPIAWVHFQLRGGWKRVLIFTIGGAIVLGALMMLSSVQGGSTRSGGAMEGWAQGLLVLEGAILILYGAGAIAQSVRNDVMNGLIESHRLMPVTAPRAMVGYLLGGGGPSLVLAGGVMILDLLAALSSNVSIDRWLMSQAALVGLAGLIWIMAAMGAFVGRAGGGILIALIAVGFFSSGFIFSFFPGLVILLLPSFERLSIRNWGQAEGYFPISLGLQAALAVLFFIGAVRRYSRDDVTCFGILPALGLLAAWVGMSILGVQHYETLVTSSYDRMSFASQGISSLAVLMVLAVIPVANSARVAARSQSSLTPRRDRALPLLTIAACLILTWMLAIFLNRLDQLSWKVQVETLVVMGAWLLGMRFLLGWVYKVVEGGFIMGFGWMLLVWFVPMVGDAILQSILNPTKDYVAGPLFACSPLGALIQIWSTTTTSRPDVTIGLAVQIGLILIPLLLFARRNRVPRLIKPVAEH